MTEEQIIINYAIIERTFDKAGDAKAQWLMIRTISEPAPPTSWRPYCFSDYDQDGKCEHEEYYMMASCDKCPYRLME